MKQEYSAAITQVLTSDNIYLPCILYSGRDSSSTLFVFVHGAGSSSIVRNVSLFNEIAASLTRINIDFLTFLNRGGGYITKFNTKSNDPYLGGMAYEKIGEFEYDIAAVVRWARDNGYKKIYLLGHSTGANKLALVAEWINAQDDIVGVALIAGGDDVALQQAAMKDRLKIVQDKANQMILDGRGLELAPHNTLPHPISWQSVDELITDGSDYDIFHFKRGGRYKYVNNLAKPALVVYGSKDFGTIIDPAAAVSKLIAQNSNLRGVIIEGADHNFTNYEKELIDGIVREFDLL